MSYIEEMFSLNGKVALVTGAASGNGAAISEALAKAGASVAMLDKNAVLEETSKNLNKLRSVKTKHYICDLTDTEHFKKIASLIEVDLGPINILVNNAGITLGQDALEYSTENWNKTYEINLKAPFEIIKVVGKRMKETGGGSIINITSLNSELAFPNNPAYVACKGALKQLTKSFALDLGKYNIRCNNLGPGYMKTNMTKKSWNNLDTRKKRSDRTILGRWGTPADLAGAVIFLASTASNYMTGQDLYIDGGWLTKGL